MASGSKLGRKPSVRLPRKLDSFYDVERDSLFWLVWELVEKEIKS